MQLKRIIEENDTTAGKTFDFFIQFLIVFSLVSFSIETLPDLSVNTKIILNIAEVITVAIFTIEYLLRLIVADKKLKFIFSFYGLIYSAKQNQATYAKLNHTTNIQKRPSF